MVVVEALEEHIQLTNNPKRITKLETLITRYVAYI